MNQQRSGSGQPGSGRKLRDAIDREVCQTRQSRTNIIPDRDFEPAAGSITETIAATRGPACSLPMRTQLRRPKATGRMAFSARLLLNSSWGCSMNRFSRVQRLKVWLLALARTLFGSASVRALWTWLLICSSTGPDFCSRANCRSSWLRLWSGACASIEKSSSIRATMPMAAWSLGLSSTAWKNFLLACALSRARDKAHYPE